MSNTPDAFVDNVRTAAAEFGCRIEVSSDEKFPVSASNQARTRYGFGYSIAEAVDNLRHRPNRLWEKAPQGMNGSKESAIGSRES
jgi:hypothetical protein